MEKTWRLPDTTAQCHPSASSVAVICRMLFTTPATGTFPDLTIGRAGTVQAARQAMEESICPACLLACRFHTEIQRGI